jgi:DNA-binding transcriptional MerR regulator
MARALAKSPEAFRTISEAADALDLPQHVLRFWETRFSQIKPMKRSGGRRYYRPNDIALLQGIRHLLYDEGYTIKGVQRILREQGIAHVVSFADQNPAEPAPHHVSAKSVGPPPGHLSPQAAPQQQPLAQEPSRPDPVRAALASPQPQQPVPPQAAQQAPVAPPAHVAPSTVSASSGLRFVAEPEPEPQRPVSPQPAPQQAPAISQAVPQPVAHAVSLETQVQRPPASQPLPTPVPPIASPVLGAPAPVLSVAQLTVPPGASQVGGQLTPHQTESLVRALRTLMDCKSQLDQARPAPTASPTATETAKP